MTKYFQFKKWGKDDKPTFKAGEYTTTEIVWKIKWIYYNEPREWVSKNTGKAYTLPANVSIALENDFYLQLTVEQWSFFRSVVNSLLSTNIWDEIELRTYINKKGYKVISVANPEVKVDIPYKDKDGNDKTFEASKSYDWVVDLNDIPEVEVIRNKKWELISIDDSEANDFMIWKLKEKFIKSPSDSNDEINVEDLPF